MQHPLSRIAAAAAGLAASLLCAPAHADITLGVGDFVTDHHGGLVNLATGVDLSSPNGVIVSFFSDGFGNFHDYLETQGPLTVDFGQNVTAGSLIFSADGGGASFTLSNGDGTNGFSGSSSAQGFVDLGAATSTPFSGFTMTPYGPVGGLLSLTLPITPRTATPEPSPLVPFALGGLALVFARRSRVKARNGK